MRIIHPIDQSHLAQVCSLSAKFEAEQVAYGYRSANDSDLSCVPLDHFWLAVDESGGPVGYAYGQASDLGESAISSASDRIFDLEDIYIVPQHRGKGRGTQLLNEVERGAVALGYNRIILYSSIKKLPPLIRFYEAAGYKTWYVQMTKEIQQVDPADGLTAAADL